MGIASNLLREYVKRLGARFHSQGIPERLLLITHEELRAFYEGVGFKWVGESEVQHGSRKWYEMRLVLPHEYDDEVTTTSSNQWQPSQEAILAALLASSSSRSSTTHATKSFNDFDNVQDLLVPDNTGTKMKNRYDLMCPRPGCGSIILRKEVGEWQRKESVVIDPIGNHTPLLPPLPQPPTETDWWLIGPSPMEFENIGFSKGVQNGKSFLWNTELQLTKPRLQSTDLGSSSLLVESAILAPWGGVKTPHARTSFG
ncbi:hypothetical protein H0H93_013327 [Arthromyces matolae]|nr:hypothetical protein H0H93_013327 [Arthromyces matolae]